MDSRSKRKPPEFVSPNSSPPPMHASGRKRKATEGFREEDFAAPAKPAKLRARVAKDPRPRKPRQPKNAAQAPPQSDPPVGSMDFIDLLLSAVARLALLTLEDQVNGVQLPMALMNFKSSSKELVLYKNKFRSKVRLDDETDKYWELLMGKKDPGYTPDDAYWKYERAMLKAKADAFIEVMDLVQGPRKFSRWGGTVVDSIVGAYLTQNVSDHLSSSAYMRLAAKHPNKRSKSRASCNTSTGGKQPATEIPPSPNGGDGKDPLAPRSPPVGDNVQSDVRIPAVRDGQQLPDLNLTPQSTTVPADHANSEPASIPAHHPRSSPSLQAEVVAHHPSSSPSLQAEVVAHHPSSSPSLQAEVVAHHPSSSPSLLQAEVVAHHPSSSPSLQAEVVAPAPQAEFVSQPVQPKFAPDLSSLVYRHPNDDSLEFQKMLRDFLSSPDCPAYSVPEIAKYRPTGGATRPSPKVWIRPTEASEGVPQDPSRNVRRKLKFQAPEPQAAPAQEPQAGPPNKRGRKSGKSKKSGADLANEELKAGRKPNPARARWLDMRARVIQENGGEIQPPCESQIDWEAVLHASVDGIAGPIKERGMHNVLAARIKAFLGVVYEEQGNLNLEWLRKIDPEEAKRYMMSIHGLGLKSVECVRLLEMEHAAFPVDTNVGRIVVRLGWVPIEPLPESVQMHLLDLYPVQATIQKYLWPRLAHLDHAFLYELHYQMITFGKVFCTKTKPNCNACPLQTQCMHFASAYSSAKLRITGADPTAKDKSEKVVFRGLLEQARTRKYAPIVEEPLDAPPTPICNGLCKAHCLGCNPEVQNTQEPFIEVPSTPERTEEPQPERTEVPEVEDIEDIVVPLGRNWLRHTSIPEEDDGEPCVHELNFAPKGQKEIVQDVEEEEEEDILFIDLKKNLAQEAYKNYDGEYGCNEEFEVELNARLEEASKALVVTNSVPTTPLKAVWRLRTIHSVYEIPDGHRILQMYELDPRLPDDPCQYSLALLGPASDATDATDMVKCIFLIPCRTAMRGSFPLNGTYFQVNEVFADYATSEKPINVPRALLWTLKRRMVYCGTSATSIFRGMDTFQIQLCFWKGYVCVRGFDRQTREPVQLSDTFHQSKKPGATKGGRRKKTYKSDEDE